MIRKILFAIFFATLIFFLKPSVVTAVTRCYWTDADMSECDAYAPDREELCCHNTGGCDSGCGRIPWYGWCHADDCCAYKVYDL